MIAEAIKKVVGKGDLSYDEAYAAMNEVMGGKTTSTQNAAYLAALSTKVARAETIDEIFGTAEAMRGHALKVPTVKGEVLELVGTGGGNPVTLSVSTAAAFIASAAGVKVARHGNIAAECFEALGINVDLEPEKCVELLNEIGICFFLAPKYHPSMKYAGQIRSYFGPSTVFNILGPLTNPARPQLMILGVGEEYLLDPLAKVMSKLGVRSGLVVYGQDGLDSISTSAATSICEVHDDSYRRYVIEPEDFDLRRAEKSDFDDFTPAVVRKILDGAQGAKTDIVLLNAAAAIYVGRKAGTLAEGLDAARKIIESGAAKNRLEEFIALSKA